MLRIEPSALPNVITVMRIVLAPAVFVLILPESFGSRLAAFVLFLVLAFSDLWDGYLARKHGWITDFGKLLDPIADKLLLIATFVPLYIVSHRAGTTAVLPVWGTLPMWVLLVVFGREILITIVRAVAARQGLVLPAGKVGKHKAVTQNIFIGSAIFWYALRIAGERGGWTSPWWEGWQVLHGAVVAISLLVAVVLTVYSMVVYLIQWRRLATAPTP